MPTVLPKPIPDTTGPLEPAVRSPAPIERAFFIAALAVMLTAGATWGAMLLWQIAAAGKFTGVSIHQVNAHGHAQVFGFMLLFIMGAGYRMFPRFWGAELAGPQWVRPVLAGAVVGLALHVAGSAFPGAGAWALPAAMLGGLLEYAAILIFTVQMVVTFRRGGSRLDPATAFIFGALAWAILMAEAGLWYTWATMTAPDRGELIGIVSRYQPALRYLQLHGLGLFVILGVCLRVMPGLVGLPRTPPRLAWTGFALLVGAVALESVAFVIFRATGSHAWAAGVMAGWALLAAGVAAVVLPWKLWRPFPTAHRSNKFIRAAFVWLAVALAMLLLTPLHQALSGMTFSHAYYGATRHALTVGFIAMMIVGMGSRIVPRLRGVDGPHLASLGAVFVLLNAGCALRIGAQIAADWQVAAYPLAGVSGVLEVAGLAIWAVHMVRLLRLPEPGMDPGPAPRGRSLRLNVLSVPATGVTT